MKLKSSHITLIIIAALILYTLWKLAREAAVLVNDLEKRGESAVAHLADVVTTPARQIADIPGEIAGTVSATAMAVEAALATAYLTIFGQPK